LSLQEIDTLEIERSRVANQDLSAARLKARVPLLRHFLTHDVEKWAAYDVKKGGYRLLLKGTSFSLTKVLRAIQGGLRPTRCYRVFEVVPSRSFTRV